jgi:hypothetical protein
MVAYPVVITTTQLRRADWSAGGPDHVEAVGGWHVQTGDDHGELAGVTRDRGNRGLPVMGRGHPEPLATTEFRKQFPRTHIVVYNERFFLGSCTYGI